MDVVRALQIYQAVVRHMSFANGARELGISITSASRQVQELEQELGARLINRTTRKLNLTEAGILVHTNGREILSGIEDLRASITSLSHSAEGTVRMTCPVSLGVRVLMPLMPKFHATYPGMTVEVSLTNRFVDLIDEGFDVAIRLGQEMPSTAIMRSLGYASSILCAAPDYLIRAGAPDLPQDVSRFDHVLYKSARQTIDSIEFSDAEGKRTVVKVKGSLFVDSTGGMREAVLSGYGLGLFPSYSVAGDLAQGRLVALLTGYGLPSVGVSIVYPHRRHLSRKTRTLVDFLSEHIRLR